MFNLYFYPKFTSTLFLRFQCQNFKKDSISVNGLSIIKSRYPELFFWGSVVFGINYFATHKIAGSFTAALKQGGYTFLLGGIFMKGCENLATKIQNRTLAIVASVIIPSALILLLTYTMHNFKGTPKPLESTIPTILIIPATAVWGYRKRKQIEKSSEALTS